MVYPLMKLITLNWIPKKKFFDFADFAEEVVHQEEEALDFASLVEEGEAEEEETIDFANFAEEVINQEEIIDFENFEEDNFNFANLMENLTEMGEEETPAYQQTTSEEFDSLEDAFAQYADENNDELAQQRELQQQSYQFFIEEVPELIGLIDTGFEQVVIEPDNINEINEIARAAHSLKGGARSAGLEDIGNIALRVEKSFKALFNENINLDEELTAYMRDIYQLLRQPLMARLENQDFDEKFNLDLANEMWAGFEEKYGEELAKAEEFFAFF